MNFSKIKNLVKQNGDKFIFVENGEPEIVMMSFGEYQKLAEYNANTRTNMPPQSGASLAYAGGNNANADRYHTGFADLEPRGVRETEFVVPATEDSPGLPVRLEDIRLEDLPI